MQYMPIGPPAPRAAPPITDAAGNVIGRPLAVGPHYFAPGGVPDVGTPSPYAQSGPQGLAQIWGAPESAPVRRTGKGMQMPSPQDAAALRARIRMRNRQRAAPAPVAQNYRAALNQPAAGGLQNLIRRLLQRRMQRRATA